MGDQFQLGSGSWWNTSSRNRFETGTAAATSSISTTLNAIASFGWPTEMVDVKSRSSNMDSATASTDEQSSNLQLMGLGPSSQSMDWNQALLSEKDEGSFRALFHEDLSSSYQPESSAAAAASQEHWRQKLYRSENDFKQISHRGFSLDQQRFSSQASSNDSTITSPNRTTAFPVDSATAYSLLPSENQQQSNYHNRPISNYAYPSYPAEMMTSTNKYPPFLRTSPPKQAAGTGSSHFHFTNITPFWTASDAGSSFFPPLQSQITIAPPFEPKPKNKAEVRDLSGATKKNSTETPNKRVRNETPTAPPGFKVRKEKMGDRITALQQLVSPFGKTDTASVLSEAIEYIKFLHEQVSALSAPYMKNGAAMQNQQNPDKSDDPEGPRQDLRTRGLCLVPVSSTFPVTHETTVDFWTPTFGGTFR